MTTIDAPQPSRNTLKHVSATWWYDQFRQYNHAYAVERPSDRQGIPTWEAPPDNPPDEPLFRRR